MRLLSGRARNASADSNVSTLQPSSRNTRESALQHARDRRRRGRWSARQTSAVMRALHRQAHAKRRSAVRIVGRGDAAVMRGDDRLADRKPDAHAAGLGAVERIEHSLQVAFAGSRARCRRRTGERSLPSLRCGSSSLRLATSTSLIASAAFRTRLSSTCCSCTRPPSMAGSAGARSVTRRDMADQQFGAQQIERLANRAR